MPIIINNSLLQDVHLLQKILFYCPAVENCVTVMLWSTTFNVEIGCQGRNGGATDQQDPSNSFHSISSHFNLFKKTCFITFKKYLCKFMSLVQIYFLFLSSIFQLLV